MRASSRHQLALRHPGRCLEFLFGKRMYAVLTPTEPARKKSRSGHLRLVIRLLAALEVVQAVAKPKP